MQTEKKSAPKAAVQKNKPAGSSKVIAVSSKPLSHGVGRRKSAVARVWLKAGNGEISVNGKGHHAYFNTDIARMAVRLPFEAVPAMSQRYNVEAYVYGGGLSAQADAVKLGISRAFLAAHEETRLALRAHSLLTVDSRLKERKKYGQKAARRGFQFVKR